MNNILIKVLIGFLILLLLSCTTKSEETIKIYTENNKDQIKNVFYTVCLAGYATALKHNNILITNEIKAKTHCLDLASSTVP